MLWVLMISPNELMVISKPLSSACTRGFPLSLSRLRDLPIFIACLAQKHLEKPEGSNTFRLFWVVLVSKGVGYYHALVFYISSKIYTPIST